jgi:hypothetical protein
MLVDYSSFDIDDPLLEATCEVYAVQDYYEFLEKQLKRVQRTHKLSLDTQLKTQRLTQDDPEWHEAIQEYSHWVEFVLPRFFRSPFLVSLYALYESIVFEVATTIQTLNPTLKRFQSFKKKKGRLGFLEISRQYYSEVLNIELCPAVSTWEKLIILSKFRHAIAHANGRIESLRPPNLKTEIIQMATDLSDVDTYSEYITFGKEFVADTTRIVLDELLRFIEENREACRPKQTV